MLGKTLVIKDGVTKGIFPSELPKYVADGWTFGSGRKSQIWINDGLNHKMIYEEDLNQYIDLGWSKGNLRFKHKSNTLI